MQPQREGHEYLRRGSSIAYRSVNFGRFQLLSVDFGRFHFWKLEITKKLRPKNCPKQPQKLTKRPQKPSNGLKSRKLC